MVPNFLGHPVGLEHHSETFRPNQYHPRIAIFEDGASHQIFRWAKSLHPPIPPLLLFTFPSFPPFLPSPSHI